MGPESSARWADFVAQKPRYVSYNDFETFQNRIESMMKDNADFLRQMASSRLSETQAASQAEKPAAVRSGGREPRAGVTEVDMITVQDDEDDLEEENDASRVSSWNFKRRRVEDSDEIGPNDSVSQAGCSGSVPVELDGNSSVSRSNSDYVDVLTKMIASLDIQKAVLEKRAHADITSSRVQERAPKVLLPLADSHKEIISKVWERDSSSLAVFKQSLTERYHLVEQDFESFCKMGSLDKILVHALRRGGVPTTTVKGKSEPMPKLPSSDSTRLEQRAWKIERQSLAGLACSSVQSWLLEYLTQRVEMLDTYLKENFETVYDRIVTETGIDVIPKTIVLAQDAALDQMDLWARAAANAKAQRRLLWLQPSQWSKQLKDQVMRFPVESGLVCGSRLGSTLEEFKTFDETLERVEATPSVRGRGRPSRPTATITRPQHRPSSPQKRARFEPEPRAPDHSYQRGGTAGRGRQSSYPRRDYRGSRPHTQTQRSQQSQKNWESFPQKSKK